MIIPERNEVINLGACDCDCYNDLMGKFDIDGRYISKAKSVNQKSTSYEEPKLIAVDLWYSDGTADTLTQIEGYAMSKGKCYEGHVNLSIENAKLRPFIKYQDQLEESMSKLRDVNTCLKTLCFMLKQYSLPDEENNVTKFETTQDMARYFELMANMCLKASEFE